MDAVLVDVIAGAIRKVAKRLQAVAITPDSLLVEDLALDSLDLVGVLMNLEDDLGLTIELDEVPNIRSVADLAGHLQSLRAGRVSAA